MDPDYAIRVILSAEYIPTGCHVCKPTGNKRYVLNRNMRVYGEDGEQVTQIEGVSLSDGSSVNLITESTRLAVVFEDVMDAADFLKCIVAQLQNENHKD